MHAPALRFQEVEADRGDVASTAAASADVIAGASWHQPPWEQVPQMQELMLKLLSHFVADGADGWSQCAEQSAWPC